MTNTMTGSNQQAGIREWIGLVSGATLAPSTLALISNMFVNPSQRALDISIWMVGAMVGVSRMPPSIQSK